MKIDLASVRADTALLPPSPRTIMETEKMANEVIYQRAEVEKLTRSTARGVAVQRELNQQLKEARKLELSGARKAHMYSRIIKKLKDKIEDKLEAIRREGGKLEGDAIAHEADVKGKLEERVKELITDIKASHREQMELTAMSEEVREKIGTMRRCQTPLVTAMFDCIREMYADDGSASIGWGERGEGDDDDFTQGSASVMEEGEGARLFSGGVFSSDEDGGGGINDDDGAYSALQPEGGEPPSPLHQRDAALKEEASIIGKIVGQNKELGELFGVEPMNERETDRDEQDNLRFKSISDLRQSSRMKYFRRFLAKLHNFQLQEEGLAGEAGGGTLEGQSIDEVSVLSEGGDSLAPPTQATKFPPIASGTSNVMTSALGGDAPVLPSRFFSPQRSSAKQMMSASTQTEPGSAGRGGRSALLSNHPTLSDGREGSSAQDLRKKLHRGVNSPAYSYGDIISVGGEGDLLRRFQPKRAVPLSYSGERGAIRNAHQALKAPSRQATPEVTGWADDRTGVDPLSGGGGKRRTGGARKPKYAGNPVLWEKRRRNKEEDEAEDRMAQILEKQRQDMLMKAAGLM